MEGLVATKGEMEAFKEMDDMTQKAWTNPARMAEAITRGVNNQTSDDARDPEVSDPSSHTSGGPPETTRGIPEVGIGQPTLDDPVVQLPEEYSAESPRPELVNMEQVDLPPETVTAVETGVITQKEILTSLTKPSKKQRVKSTLPRKGKGLVAIPDSTSQLSSFLGAEDMTIEGGSQEHPTSESSEVASISVSVRELTGVVDSLSRDLTTALTRIESRLSILESRAAQSNPTSVSHKRVISVAIGPKLPVVASPELVRVSTPTTYDQAEELMEACGSVKYTPSALAQKQILMKLNDGVEVKGVKLPVSRRDWKAEYLCRLILTQ